MLYSSFTFSKKFLCSSLETITLISTSLGSSFSISNLKYSWLFAFNSLSKSLLKYESISSLNFSTAVLFKFFNSDRGIKISSSISTSIFLTVNSLSPISDNFSFISSSLIALFCAFWVKVSEISSKFKKNSCWKV